MNFSKQRNSILDYLKNTKEHPTAERIYSDLKPSLPNLSLATVYRNLGRLCETGEVVRLAAGGKTDRFDADTSDHQHFVCTSCGEVSDLFFQLPADILNENLGERFSPHHYRLFVYGLCKRCRETTNAEQSC